MDPRWATLDTIGGKTVLRFERRLAHPPDKVFRAISEPAELAHWFPALMEAELRAGAPIRFTFEEGDAAAPPGEILEVDPPKLLVYAWGDDVLRWEIVPDGDGCRLFFSHTIAEDGLSGGRPGAARNAAGWDVCLAALAARIDGEDAPAAAWFPLFEGYVERFGLAEGIAEESADGFVLRFERDVVQPPDSVWLLLTEGAEPVVGAKPTRRLWHDRAAPGRVIAVEPGRFLEYDAEPAGTVRWDLRRRVPGSLIVVTQVLPAAHAELRPAALAAWQVHLELLVAALQGIERCWPEERVTALEARYAARLGGPALTRPAPPPRPQTPRYGDRPPPRTSPAT